MRHVRWLCFVAALWATIGNAGSALSDQTSDRLDEDARLFTEKPPALENRLRSIKAKKVFSCSAKDWKEIESDIVILELRANYWALKAQQREWFDKTGAIAADNAMLSRKLLSITAGFRLNLADTALAASCLDNADSNYRNVITAYVGSSITAQRERARLGVDDVRGKRKR